jgi:hypothetical protein
VANESLFAVVFKKFGTLGKGGRIINAVSTLTDWSRMTSATSPYVFLKDSLENRTFIEKGLRENQYAVFLRKVAPTFPEDVLAGYIFRDTPIRKKIALYLLDLSIRIKYNIGWGFFIVAALGGLLGFCWFSVFKSH